MKPNDDAKRTMLLRRLVALALGTWALAACVGAQEGSDAEMAVRSRLLDAYGTRNLMAQPKAGKKHDRVTIRINETTTAKHEATTDLNREATAAVEATNWVTLGFDDQGQLVLKPRASATPQLAAAAEREHNADAETERKQSFQSTLSGEVVDVLPNGHLLVEARSAIEINEEEQTMVFMGRVDPRDLDGNNAVDATYVIDKRIRFNGKGAISQFNRRGWLARVFDRVNPF
jgi:flagellar L-ring protein precursor FlgH